MATEVVVGHVRKGPDSSSSAAHPSIPSLSKQQYHGQGESKEGKGVQPK
jgi:hypothetical protein